MNMAKATKYMQEQSELIRNLPTEEKLIKLKLRIDYLQDFRTVILQRFNDEDPLWR